MKSKIAIILALLVTNVQNVKLDSKAMQFMQNKADESVAQFLEIDQQSHNCNYNIDRIKKGPVDWTKIESTGKIFTDHSFPADVSMLAWKEYPRTIGGLAKYISWFKDFRRPRDLILQKSEGNEVSLFGHNYDKSQTLISYDIEQGAVGDNYFLTVLAALSQKQGFVPQLFHQQKYNQEGIFAIKCFVKGRPEDVTVDDLFPVYQNEPAFAKPTNDSGWWIPLLEKAYAKVNVNYEMISSGSQAEAARFLTGAPTQEYTTNFQTVNQLWNTLQINLQNKYIITAACFIENNGLQSGQGYIVQNYVIIKKADGSYVKLLKMRDPWKSTNSFSNKLNSKAGDWTGKYSLKDPFWTKARKEGAGANKLNPGEFFIGVDDFKESFKFYTVTHLHDNWQNTFIEKRNAVNKKAYRFNFAITEEHISGQGDKKPNMAQVESEENQEPIDKEDIDVSNATAATAEATDASVEDSNGNQSRPPNAENLMIESMLDMEESPLNDGSDQSQENEDNDEDDELQGDVSNIQQKEEGDEKDEIITDDNENAQDSKNHHDFKQNIDMDMDADNLEDLSQNQTQSQKVLSLVQKSTPVKNISIAVAETETKLEAEDIEEEQTVQIYVGAELYAQRMFPYGCPSFQKISVKLYRVSKDAKSKTDKFQLIDNSYFTNKDGFGYILRNLTKGNYQLQVKKYSFGFDVYDFTARIYSEKNIIISDVEQQEQNKMKKKQDKKKQEIEGAKTVTVTSEAQKSPKVQKHFTKAGDQDTNEKRMIDIDPHSQIDMEQHKQDLVKDVQLEEVKQAEKGTSNGQIETIRGPLFSKLNKASRLASDIRADKFFETHRREFYYMKDAIDKKHGFYFLRVGSNNDDYDLTLKIKMFVKGNIVETTEKSEKLYVYQYPEDKFPDDYKLTTFCNIRPLKGKKYCDFLVPTVYHDRTYVYIQKKLPASKR